MDIISQQKLDDQRDQILEKIQEGIIWYATDRKQPKYYDGDSTGHVWAYDRSARIGLPVSWTVVCANPHRYNPWTHTPNIPLKHSKIWGGKK
jgi:hypothetical protein